MGKHRGPYKAEFPAGTCVRIVDRQALEHFIATWRFHNPLTAEQLDYAGQLARIRSVGFYFGADELYWLAGIPGTWHEELLSAATEEEAVSVPELAPEGKRSRRGIASLLGILAGFVVGCALYFGAILLGAATGVVAMCPTAPEWWAYLFFGILFMLPVAGAIAAGLRVGRWYLRRA